MKQNNKYYLIFFAHPVVQKFPFVVKREGKAAISILPADHHYYRSTPIKMVIFIVWVWILPHEHDRRELELGDIILISMSYEVECHNAKNIGNIMGHDWISFVSTITSKWKLLHSTENDKLELSTYTNLPFIQQRNLSLCQNQK